MSDLFRKTLEKTKFLENECLIVLIDLDGFIEVELSLLVREKIDDMAVGIMLSGSNLDEYEKVIEDSLTSKSSNVSRVV
ncbi:hypothetical protein JJQ60_20295 [Aquimarina mytili]|uniref:Uncharacterized protein n=2 Tax=Aquimarina mytili TaxID=874423 RepID=A0A937A1I2_9FLAO|nr:hypothetical protein [Aquimarina mytili]